jgi:hypothetical protein
MLGKTGFIAIAVISAGVGAHSLNPGELYNEMYPVEGLKRDAFHICNDADPTFVRAVKVDREACFDSMPAQIELALGRIRPGGALEKAALTDPSRQAELLIQIAAIPPRQPVTAPRSFADTTWARALSPCAQPTAPSTGALAFGAAGLPAAPGAGRAAALDMVKLANLPPLPQRNGGARPGSTATLAPGTATLVVSAAADSGDTVPAFGPLPAPDIGDKGPPAIVPLQPGSCG